MERFKSEVESEWMFAHWDNPDELASKVTASLANYFSNNPKGGWVKASDFDGTKNIIQPSKEEIERHEATFITKVGDEKKTKFCSRCYDVDHKFVQLNCDDGSFYCPECHNAGVYDVILFHAASERIKEQQRNRKPYDVYESYY